MRTIAQVWISWLWPSTSLLLLLLFSLPNMEALILRELCSRHAVEAPEPTICSVIKKPSYELLERVKELHKRYHSSLPSVPSSTAKTGPPSAFAGAEIPLWGQCGLAPGEVCAGAARCICKDQWWSQCRVPIDGSWIPPGEVWPCTGPKASIIASSPLPPHVTTSTNVVTSHESPLHSSTMPVAGKNPVASKSPLVSKSPAASTVHSTPAPVNGGTHLHLPSSSLKASADISSSSTSPPRASAYAKPFVISVSARMSSNSSSLVASKSTTTSTSKFVGSPNGNSHSSNTYTRPNLACPSHSASEDGSVQNKPHSMAMQACNPNMPVPTGNLFSTTHSSSTTDVPRIPAVDPDKSGTYMEANATADQQSHCLNFAAHQYQVCWGVLNVTGYVRDWVSFNRKRCDNLEMGFADCFLYVEVGGGANCTSFTGRSQCASPDAKTFIGRTNGAQAYYVAFNIWNIQNWFFTYYMAVNGANGLTADSVNTIARTLNLPLPKNFPMLDLLAGLAWSFGLLSPSGYAAAFPYIGEKIEGLAAEAPGEYLLRAMQNAPTLSRNLINQGDLSDSDVQVAELSSGLARIVSQLETNIQNSIVLVMSNFSLFFDFVQDGFFSTQIENLNTITQNVTLSLNTYVVSQALQNDKVIITRALNTDINELQANGSAVQYNTGCGHGYDEWGMCGSWWYDSTNHISYGLESLKDMLNNYTDPLQSLFNQGITTPELLFMNSQYCADAAGSTQGNAPGTSLGTTTGVWNTECISNMKICTWDVVKMSMFSEFTDCNRESAFAMEECGDGEGITQTTVPASYIGPYLTSEEYQGIVCDKWGKGMGSPG